MKTVPHLLLGSKDELMHYTAQIKGAVCPTAKQNASVHHRLLRMYQIRTTEPTPITARGTKLHHHTLRTCVVGPC